MNSSNRVCPLRTTISTPSDWTERITASVTAMMGGVSITMNLNFLRNSAMASAMRWEESRSAGLGGNGPVGMAERFSTAGC